MSHDNKVHKEPESISMTDLKMAFRDYLTAKGFHHESDKQIQWRLFWDKVKRRINA
jgi:hypothetical protein